MQHAELAALAGIPVEVIERYEVMGLWTAAAPAGLAQLQRVIVLESLGFPLGQIARALQSVVSSAQLRGMLRYRQCVDATFDGADITARIEQIEELERIPS